MVFRIDPNFPFFLIIILSGFDYFSFLLLILYFNEVSLPALEGRMVSVDFLA